MRTHTNDTLGDRLIAIRGERSQKAFSEVLGVHVNTISKYERGERVPDADLLSKIAQEGINIHWLVTGEGPMLVKDLRGPASVQGVDPGIIRDVVEAIEELMAERFATMPPAEKAELTALLCEEIAEQERAGQMVNRRSAVRFALIGR